MTLEPPVTRAGRERLPARLHRRGKDPFGSIQNHPARTARPTMAAKHMREGSLALPPPYLPAIRLRFRGEEKGSIHYTCFSCCLLPGQIVAALLSYSFPWTPCCTTPRILTGHSWSAINATKKQPQKHQFSISLVHIQLQSTLSTKTFLIDFPSN